MSSFQDASTEAVVLDTIPEDRPSNEWMPRSVSLQRWWDVMTLRSSSRSSGSSNAGSSGAGGNRGTTNTSIPSDEAEIQERIERGVGDIHTGQTVGMREAATSNSARRDSCCGRTHVPLSLVALVVAIMVGAAVGIFFIVHSTKAEPAKNMATPQDVPTSTATPPEDSAFGDNVPTEEDKMEIDALLESISGNALVDETSPQSMARRWLLNEDPAQVNIRVHGEDRVRQRYSLGVLYFALGGPEWNTGDFLTSDNECEWTGIVCNGAGLGIDLNLTDLGLNGSIPAEIGELSLLEQIVLSSNSITGDIPSRLWGLPFLYVMDLGENQLSGTLSSLLFDLPFLEQFFLHSNNLTGTLPELPSSAPPLKHIWLYENKFTGRLPSSLSKLVDLTTLVLYDNAFDSTLDLQWSAMTNLFYMDLSWNQFSGSLPTELAATTSLKFIYFNNNTMTGALDENLGELRHLQELWLQSNDFTGQIPSRWSKMESLSTLLLYDNVLSGSVPDSICNLTLSGNLSIFETDCMDKGGDNGDGFISCDCCSKCH